MTKGQAFEKRRKCKNGHCSSKSTQAWCDFDSKEDIIIVNNRCPTSKYKCQKQITFTSRQ